MDEYGGNNQIGNEGMKIYMVVMGMKLPSFPTKGGQRVKHDRHPCSQSPDCRGRCYIRFCIFVH